MYITVPTANSLLSGEPDVDTWTALGTAQKNALLERASRRIELLEFRNDSKTYPVGYSSRPRYVNGFKTPPAGMPENVYAIEQALAISVALLAAHYMRNPLDGLVDTYGARDPRESAFLDDLPITVQSGLYQFISDDYREADDTEATAEDETVTPRRTAGSIAYTKSISSKAEEGTGDEGPAPTLTTGVVVEDEGVKVGENATTLNFTGDGVEVTGDGDEKTIDVSGGGGGIEGAIQVSPNVIDKSHIPTNFRVGIVTAEGAYPTGTNIAANFINKNTVAAYDPTKTYHELIFDLSAAERSRIAGFAVGSKQQMNVRITAGVTELARFFYDFEVVDIATAVASYPGKLEITPNNIEAKEDLDGTYQAVLSGLNSTSLKAKGVNVLELWFNNESIHTVSPWSPVDTYRLDAVLSTSEETQIGLTNQNAIPVSAVFRKDGDYVTQTNTALTIGGVETTALTQAQRIALLAITSDPGSVSYTTEEELKAALGDIDIRVSNPELLTGELWVEGTTGGVPSLARTKWTTSTAALRMDLTGQNIDSVYSSLESNNAEDIQLRLGFYGQAVGGVQIERLDINMPLVKLPAVSDSDVSFVNPPKDLTDTQKDNLLRAVGAKDASTTKEIDLGVYRTRAAGLPTTAEIRIRNAAETLDISYTGGGGKDNRAAIDALPGSVLRFTDESIDSFFTLVYVQSVQSRGGYATLTILFDFPRNPLVLQTDNRVRATVLQTTSVPARLDPRPPIRGVALGEWYFARSTSHTGSFNTGNGLTLFSVGNTAPTGFAKEGDAALEMPWIRPTPRTIGIVVVSGIVNKEFAEGFFPWGMVGPTPAGTRDAAYCELVFNNTNERIQVVQEETNNHFNIIRVGGLGTTIPANSWVRAYLAEV